MIAREIIKQLELLFRDDEVALVGMGNTDRADDGAGIMVADALKNLWPRLVFSESDQSVDRHVLHLLENTNVRSLIFVDTANFNGQPGEIRILDSQEISNIVSHISTHRISLPLLMNALHQHGKESCLIGIQPETTALFQEMSPLVRNTIENLIRLLKSHYQKK